MRPIRLENIATGMIIIILPDKDTPRWIEAHLPNANTCMMIEEFVFPLGGLSTSIDFKGYRMSLKNNQLISHLEYGTFEIYRHRNLKYYVAEESDGLIELFAKLIKFKKTTNNVIRCMEDNISRNATSIWKNLKENPELI